MKTTVSPISQSIVLRLDVAIAFEALILNRLRRLPKTRREEWLRGLLVKGFQRECRALRDVQRDWRTGIKLPPKNQDTSAHRLVSTVKHHATVAQRTLDRPAEHASSAAQHANNTVSFGALRKVIG